MFQQERPLPGENPEKEGSARADKELAWRQKLKEIEKLGDSLDYPVDNEIKETLVAFQLMGIQTSASCEGHPNRGRGAPWIRVEAPNKPDERFMNENQVFRVVAEKYGVPYEDVKKDIHHHAWIEAMNEACEKEETGEYRHWRDETKKLLEKVAQLITEFYQSREVAPHVRLIIEETAEGSFKIHNGGKDYETDPRKLTDEERAALSVRLKKYQRELGAFTHFLREKYFQGA